jgi:hypothetical protein
MTPYQEFETTTEVHVRTFRVKWGIANFISLFKLGIKDGFASDVVSVPDLGVSGQPAIFRFQSRPNEAGFMAVKVQLLNTERFQLQPYRAVLRIRDILVWIRIRGSMPLTNGSGFCLFSSLTFKTPAKKLILKQTFSAFYFLKVRLHNFSKIKSPKEVTKQ